MRSKLSAETLRLRAAEIIRSLPSGASSVLSILDPAIDWRGLQRPCDNCGSQFTPKNPLGRFCSNACSLRWWHGFPEFRARIYTPERNRKAGEARSKFLRSGTPEAERQRKRIGRLKPMRQLAARKKLSETLRRIGHKPKMQGGNGRPTALPQSLLFSKLKGNWKLEYVLSTSSPGCEYLPHHYKLDIANPKLKIAIEVDGGLHLSKAVQKRDRRKTKFMISRGWKVLRFWNKDILNWARIGMPKESFISTTLKQNGIHLLV